MSPRELRDQILDYVMSPNSRLPQPFITHVPTPSSPFPMAPPHKIYSTYGPLLTNRQLSAEAS